MFSKRINFLKFAGIKIGIDLSWFFIALLLSWTLAAGYFPFYYPDLSLATYWLMGVVGMLGLFACVVLHELGHAVVAKHFKLPISQITLFIFGGVAEIKKEPTRPKVEFLMAIAGPIVSVVLALFMYFLTVLGDHLQWPLQVRAVTGYLASVNAVIVIFNLIPAFPLDGGRVLRAILWWWKKNFGWATKISTNLGAGFGLFLIFFGALSFITGSFIAGFWLMILGLFLRRAASSSRSQFYVGQELSNEKVQKFMKKDPICVPPDITIKELVQQYVYQSHHHLYPVTEKGKLIGYISLKEVKSIAADDWEKTIIRQALVPISKFKTVSPRTNALQALDLMQQTDLSALLVVEENQLLGILTAQDLFKLIFLKLELEESTR
jgi:Zn-dependent protease/CBS domain-containing protein